MKILMIVPSLRNGGAERVVSKLSKSFESLGHSVLVVAFSAQSVDYRVNNLVKLNSEPSINNFSKIIKVFYRLIKIRNIKKKYLPNVSISFLFGANVVNVLTKQKKELTITSVRNTIDFEGKLAFSKYLNSIVYRLSDFIVSVSHGISFEILEKYVISPNKIKVVYNFVRISRDVTVKENPKIPIRLITLGRLTQQKAQWHLIHAVRILKNNYPDLVLYVLGQGELFEQYQALITDLGLEQNILLLGFQSDVEYNLNESDIFCLSSRNEGLPNVILEAMNQGLPIISTDIPHGPREILNPNGTDVYENDENFVEEKYGLLVDYGDNPRSNEFGYRDEYIVNQFVKKINLLIKDKELFNHYSKQSLKRVQDFSEETIVSQWIELFEEGMKHL